MSSNPVVETHDLTKRFGEFTALDGLSISVDAGQILGFIGPNGAGKTTAIRILVGLLRPTSGTARIAGADCVRDARRIKRLVGYMPDTFGSYDNMRVTEYLDFFGSAFEIPRRDRMVRIEHVLHTTNSTWMKDRFVESLSHGMKQRVGLARTLLHDPQVLILDEPANGLDPQARIEMREILLRLAEMGKTLIVTSHILPELSRICSAVAIVTQGKLRAFGKLQEIMRQIHQRRTFEVQLLDAGKVAAAREFVQGFLGAESDGTAGSEVSSSAKGSTGNTVGSETEGTVRFETQFSDERLAGLLSQLVERGFAVAQFREIPTDLEDAFLTVTRRDQQAALAAAGGTPAT